MAVVDLQWWDRNMCGVSKGIDRGWPECDNEQQNFNIMHMSNLIGRPLSDGRLKYYNNE